MASKGLSLQEAINAKAAKRLSRGKKGVKSESSGPRNVAGLSTDDMSLHIDPSVGLVQHDVAPCPRQHDGPPPHFVPVVRHVEPESGDNPHAEAEEVPRTDGAEGTPVEEMSTPFATLEVSVPRPAEGSSARPPSLRRGSRRRSNVEIVDVEGRSSPPRKKARADGPSVWAEYGDTSLHLGCYGKIKSTVLFPLDEDSYRSLSHEELVELEASTLVKHLPVRSYREAMLGQEHYSLADALEETQKSQDRAAELEQGMSRLKGEHLAEIERLVAAERLVAESERKKAANLADQIALLESQLEESRATVQKERAEAAIFRANDEQVCAVADQVRAEAAQLKEVEDLALDLCNRLLLEGRDAVPKL